MEFLELAQILAAGEDSKHQFKSDFHNSDQLAAEIVAFANSNGGHIFIGVDDKTGLISGLDDAGVRRLNMMISNVASQNVRPAINPTTENIITENGVVLIVTVPVGVNRPYQDKDGAFWVKNGADKRKATSREELQRMFQDSDLIHADEARVSTMTVADLDLEYFRSFFHRRYGKTMESQNLPLPQLLRNLNLLNGDSLNLTCAMIFGKNSSSFLPAFVVKAGAFNDVKITTNTYADEREITGKFEEIFTRTVDFIIANLHRVQGDQGFNSVGIPEIPRSTIEELVSNALVHRDYFISAPVRVFVFYDRVEIISPGHLPNNLQVENIKLGNSCTRNPALASFAYHIIPYRGYGSGILRAIEAYPDIEFIDDHEGNNFKVVIRRVNCGK
ncbi:MAG: putative DNA binding domain-containing protein [Clostridiales Family XIII bacterium]|jgi:ATP-dependent DNA helicase RecG|nr:putative DNA binding domain-containing protein [Clostridiales Family XIII bacterium]